MKTKIRTANETISGMTFPIVFAIIWVTLIGYQFIKNGIREEMVFIFLVGMILPIQSLRFVRNALKYRQVHEHFLKNYKPQKGKIVNITKELSDDASGKKKKICYYLQIEILNASGQMLRRVKSEGYSMPIYKYLASPDVDVYYDNQLKYVVVDGFHLKTDINEPDLMFEDSNIYDETIKPKTEIAPVVKYVWIGAGVLIALQIILMVFWK